MLGLLHSIASMIDRQECMDLLHLVLIWILRRYASGLVVVMTSHSFNAVMCIQYSLNPWLALMYCLLCRPLWMMTWWCLDPQFFLLKSNHLLTIFMIFFLKSMGPPSLAHIMLAKHGRHAAKGKGGKGGRRGRRREEGEEGEGQVILDKQSSLKC